MSPKTRWAFIAIVALQLLFLLGLAAYKEMTVRTGQEVVLQTVPIDPRDLFRGDYVVLRYKVSSLSHEPRSERESYAYPLEGLSAGATIYVVLEQRGDVWEAVRVERARPADKFAAFLKGKVMTADRQYPYATQVEYGIESYFVPEGQGRELEAAAQKGALLVRVAVNASGEAVIKELIVDGQPWRPK